jgi:dienelactone hydrolase
MKPIPLPKATAHRHKVWLPGALLVCAAVLSLAGARAQEAQQPGATLASPAAEALEVDASLFTVQSFDWFDSQRQRPVPAKLYLPAAKPAVGSVPLVVFSHGIGGSRDGYSYLGRYFAAHGYGSLHVQHVGSDRQIWSGNPFALPARLSDAAQASEALNRVQDLRFSLDTMLAAPAGALFDARRIVAAGHSYGANTTMLIAGAQVQQQGQKVSLRDPRISACHSHLGAPFLWHGGSQQDPLQHRRSDAAHHGHRGRDSDPGLRLWPPGSDGHFQRHGQRACRTQGARCFQGRVAQHLHRPRRDRWPGP